MISRLAYYLAAFVVIFPHNMISPVKGQCTVQSCENRDSSLNVAADVNGEAIRNLDEQVQSIRELITESFKQLRNQQDTALTSLQAVERSSKEQVQGIYDFLNTSFQQMKTQQQNVMNVDRCSQEQDIDAKQVENIHGLLNSSLQQINNLNVSLQELKNQQDAAVTNLQTVDQRLQEQGIYLEQVPNIHGLLNASLRQMNDFNLSFLQLKVQQDSATISLQSIDRRSQEQDIYIKQVQNNRQLLNISLQQMNNLNASIQHLATQQDTVVTSLQAADSRSQEQVQGIYELLNATFQQMKTQHDSVLSRLETIGRRLNEHDFSTKNQTQNSLKRTDEVPTQLELGIDLGGVSVLLPTVNNWIILLQRLDGSLSFNRNWNDYKNGFGDIGRGEIWLGNEKVHRLTNGRGLVYTLRIEVQLKTSGSWFYAEYSTFSLESETNKYRLQIQGFSGSAGDALTNRTATSWWLQGGMKFTTLDSDNDNSSGSNCANVYQAGFWYNSCWFSCLTCQYGTKFAWQSLQHLESGGSLRAARMMIKGR